MGPRLTKLMAAAIVIGALLMTALFLFVLYDTPEEDPVRESPRIYIIHGDLPYPEENTMHYITEEGEVIVYAGENK